MTISKHHLGLCKLVIDVLTFTKRRPNSP